MTSGIKRTWDFDTKSDAFGDISEFTGAERPLFEGHEFDDIAAPVTDGSQLRAELEDAIRATGGAGPASDLATCACLLEEGVRAGETNAPRPSNTGGVIRKITKKSDGANLHPPSFYRSASAGEWVEKDVQLFESLPQGGGGIDWLTFSGWGSMTEAGAGFMRSLRHAKDNFGLEAEQFRSVCAEAGLSLVDFNRRKSATFDHPEIKGAFVRLADASSGVGRQFQPLIVSCEGVTVRYGARENSDNGGFLCTVEVPGTIWLRLGEAGALLHVQKILLSFGLELKEMRASRFDACADIPGLTVDAFVELFRQGYGAGSFKGSAKLHMGKDGHAETFMLASKAVELVIYDKVKEVALDKTGEKLPLMLAHRWGSMPTTAVRVEWRFKMSKIRAKPKKGETTKYKSLRELFEGMGELLGWAMNTWGRFCLRDDSKNVDRAEYCDEWVRVLHAFAFWSHRFGRRPAAKPVEVIPQIQLIKQASGTFAAAFGGRGIVPADEWTVWALMSQWLGPDDIVERCRAKAREAMCLRGVKTVVVDADNYLKVGAVEDGRI